MNHVSYQAVKVMFAVHSVFVDIGGEQYAEKKTNSFLRRCGADINKPKEQLLDIDDIKDTAYAMLDTESEKAFWLKLNNR